MNRIAIISYNVCHIYLDTVGTRFPRWLLNATRVSFCVELCVLRGEHGMSSGWKPFGRLLPAVLLCCKGAPYGMQQKLCLGKLPTLSTLNGSSLEMAMLTIRRCALVIARSLKNLSGRCFAQTEKPKRDFSRLAGNATESDFRDTAG
mgnify:CR=1 FL=1